MNFLFRTNRSDFGTTQTSTLNFCIRARHHYQITAPWTTQTSCDLKTLPSSRNQAPSATNQNWVRGEINLPSVSGSFTSSLSFSSVQFSHSVFAILWTAACQASLSITNFQSLLKLMSIESVMPDNYLILCLQSFPASGSFPVSQFFASGGPSIGVSASASALPINIQDWFPLE